MPVRALLGIVALALLGLAYVLLAPGEEPAPEAVTEPLEAVPGADQPGPYLQIEVAGEASGVIRIDLAETAAPEHTERLLTLAENGEYDNVAFHRVIEGFMAQTGDVQYGKADGDASLAGRGGSDLPDLAAEFSEIPYDRGVVGMARSSNPNSANSQFFIMFDEGHFLNGQYTVVGRVVEGMEVVDRIKRGRGQSGSVEAPADVMTRVTVER